MPKGEVYEIRQVFEVPRDFAYRWCTDYTPEDGLLARDGHRRRILSRTKRRVVYETLYDYPAGWFWSRQTVTLHPPDRWTATAHGNYRTWDLVYTVKPLDPTTTAFTLRGIRTPVGLSKKNPSQRSVKAELNAMWRNFGRAMRSDYLRARKRNRKARRNRSS
jgi:hypothetical protein